MEANNKYEIPARVSDEVITRVPSWITKWGTTYLFIITIVMLVLAYYIKYPEIVTGTTVITTSTPAAKLVANTTGKIKTLYVSEGAPVSQNTTLLVLENTANIEDVNFVNAHINDLEKMLFESNFVIKDDSTQKKFDLRKLQLGELQSSYSNLFVAVEKYKYHSKDKSITKQILTLKEQLNKYKTLKSQYKTQAQILETKTNIEKKKMENDMQLVEEKIISKEKAEASTKSYYDELLSLQSNKNNITQADLQASEYQKNILQLKQSLGGTSNQLQLEMESSFENFKSELAQWLEIYIIKSPIEGKVSFNKFWSANQFVQKGEPVISVIPAQSELIGKGYITIANSGKVKVGQTVKIKLDNFPFQEFGIINGKVKSVSHIAFDKNYSIDIELPNGAVTSYNKTLPTTQELQGSIEIITEDLSLLQRFFNPLKYLIKNN